MRTGILWCFLMTAAGFAQGPGAGETQPLFRARTQIVEVTLQATEANGSAVEDLKAEELRLFDNNREQTIAIFEKVGAAAVEARRGGQPPAVVHRANRLSILLLDALNTDWSDQIYARQAAARVLEQIPAGERIAIFVLSDTLRLLHDFSSDGAALKGLIQRFSGTVPRDTQVFPANPLAAEFSYSDLVRAKEPGSVRLSDFRQRQRILATLEALTAIARLVKGAPGQKNLLWLSAGFPLRIGSGMPGTEMPGTESFHEETLRTTRNLNAANVSVYPIDARGLSVSPQAYINIGTMQELAAETGGRAYYNSNDLASLTRSAFDDSRRAYLLTYAPSDAQADGKFHSIRLRTIRRGVRLRYRPGYYADSQKASKP